MSYDKFCEVKELLEDYEDLIDLRKAKQEEKDKPTVSLDDVKQQLKL